MDIQSTLTLAIEIIVMSFVALMIFDFIDGLYVVPLPLIISESTASVTAPQLSELPFAQQLEVEPQQIPLITAQFEEIPDPTGIKRNWLTRLQFSLPRVYQLLIEQGLDPFTVGAAYTVNKTRISAVTRSLKDVRIIWRYFDKQGNASASLLVDALAEDSLKSRFEQVWGEERTVLERWTDDCRILSTPCPWTRVFETEFEENLARISKLHKKHIQNGKYCWEFIYSWMTPEEKAKLDIVNPVVTNGRRKYKIHQMLSFETKERLTPHVTSILILMKSANSVAELRRLVQRQYGVDQPNLFDGWNVK